MKVLVTGGAGYIGSITTQILIEKGFEVVVYDNLSTGYRKSISAKAEFIMGDIRDQLLLKRVIKDRNIQAVIHFAAKLIVPESVQAPYDYYENNVLGGLSVLEACRANGVGQFIFSSTAAVYGSPAISQVTEETPLAPENPYGHSKAMMEKIIQDYTKAYGLKAVILRYFNVAGAMPSLQLGQRSATATHLVKVAAQAANKIREKMSIFGVDYPTKDGTGVRDYIHVVDLANAHILALEYLRAGGETQVFNCGYGHGYSVREVVDTMKQVTAENFKVIESGRRPGDAIEIVANSAKIKSTLKWSPEFADLKIICKTAYDWEKKIMGEKL